MWEVAKKCSKVNERNSHPRQGGGKSLAPGETWGECAPNIRTPAGVPEISTLRKILAPLPGSPHPRLCSVPLLGDETSQREAVTTP